MQPDGTFADHVYWRPEHVRRPEFAGMSSTDWRDAVLAALRLAVQAPHGRGRPRRRAALRRPRLVAGRGPARAGGPGRAQDVQRRLPRHGGRVGRRVRVLRPRRARVRHRPPADPRRPRPAAAGRRRGDHGDGRADGQPRLRGVLPAVRRRSPSRSRSCSPGRARTRCSPATAGTRRWPRCRASRAPVEYAKVFTDRPHAELAHILEPDWLLDDDPCRAFIRDHFAMPGADDDAGRRAAAWTRRSCSWTTRSSGSTT